MLIYFNYFILCKSFTALGKLLLGKLRILLHGEIGVGDVAVAEIKNFTAWGNWCWGNK